MDKFRILPAYNYYNFLAWNYKFSRTFSSDYFFFNNSDLSLSIRFRRRFVPYVPFLPKIFFKKTIDSFFYCYISLQSKNRFKNSKRFKLSDFSSNFFIFDSLIFKNFFFYQIFKDFYVVFSDSKLEKLDKLLFIGSYDPINNNFYDSSFLVFFNQIEQFLKAEKILESFQLFFPYNSFDFTINVFFKIFHNFNFTHKFSS